MNRRELLDPRLLAQTAGSILSALEEPPTVPQSDRGELPLTRFSRRAMATSFEIAIPFGTPGALEAAEDGLDLVNRLESQLTVYRDDSEISVINRHAAFGHLHVEPRLFALLQLASRIHSDTSGAYDIAVGALIKAWAIHRRQGGVPSVEERAEAITRCGMQRVALEAQHGTVHFRAPGIEINLGSIGKGYALDRVSQELRQRWNIHSALLHGGTSSVLALGTPPNSPRGWQVGLGHPSNLQRRIGSVWLRDQALGTSAATFQLGHILDPRTGCPAEEVISASAVAPTAAEADSLATAFFVLGVAGTRLYCERHPEIGAVLLPASNAVPVVIGNVDFQ